MEWTPDEASAEYDIARLDSPRQDFAALDGAHGKTGEIEILAGIEPGHLRRLAADEGAAGLTAAVRDALDDPGARHGVEAAGGEVVEEEQGLGALDDQVVDAHRHQVDPDRIQDAGIDGELELGADAVGGGDQHRVLEPRRLEVEQRAEAAELGVRAAPPRRPCHGRDQVDQGVPGIDVDAGIGVGARLSAAPTAPCHAAPRFRFSRERIP